MGAVRVLYIQPSLVPPPTDPRLDRFRLLSERLEGEVLQPVWFGEPREVDSALGPNSYPAYSSGRFRYHFLLAMSYPGRKSKYATLWFYIRKGLELHREKPFDCIVVYSHQTTGLIGIVLKMLTRAKLVVEVVTAPELVCITERPHPTFGDRMRKRYSDVCLHVSLFMSDRVHLLFPSQLRKYPLLRRRPASVFHDFVPVSVIKARSGPADEPFILLVGAPWYLKGADLLIKAFLRVAPDFPDVRLKVQGYFPDPENLRALTDGSDRVEILPAVPLPQTLERMSQATIFALPSRCEGLPRVIIEAMGAGVPVIGSDVGGIPSLIKDGENGFVIPAGNVDRLETRLRELLSDPVLRERLGKQAFTTIHSEMSEATYVKEFADMVERAVAS